MNQANELNEKLKLDQTLRSLKRNGFKAFYFPTREKALSKIITLIPQKVIVGFGGSVTLREMGLPQILEVRGNQVADHWKAMERGASIEEIEEIRRMHINSDVFITSINAITENGELVNIDGVGQRVAAMIFGPKKVIVVAGLNKIVRNIDEALYRARNTAAVMNAKRSKLKTPCTVTGWCSDCDSIARICNVTTIMHRKPRMTDITIVLINEKLGY